MNTLNTPVIGTGGLIDTTPDEIRKVLAPTMLQTAQMERVVMARAFNDGFHGVRLTARLREFLGRDSGQFQMRLNMCRKINTAITERLIIDGIDSKLGDGDEKTQQIAFANTVFDGSRMKGNRRLLLGAAVQDGGSYILIDFDKANNRPRMEPHASYTDPAISSEAHSASSWVSNNYGTAAVLGHMPNLRDTQGGNGEGMWMKYPNDNSNKKPLYAVKRWVETNDGLDPANPKGDRVTIYYPERIEYWVESGKGWVNFDTKPWVDVNGEALGIPVVHLKAPDELPAAFEGIPLQRGLNKGVIDAFASSDADANRILVALGFEPYDKDGKPWDIVPGVWVGTTEKDASVEAIEGGSSANHTDFVDKIVSWMSDAVDVPLSLLNQSAQRAAEGTIQEEKESFAAKVRAYQESFEMAIEDAFKIARRIHNAFAEIAEPTGTQELYGYGELEERGEFSVKWAPFTARSIADTATEATAWKAANVPDEIVWAKLFDFSPQEVTAMKAVAKKNRFAEVAAMPQAAPTQPEVKPVA